MMQNWKTWQKAALGCGLGVTVPIALAAGCLMIYAIATPTGQPTPAAAAPVDLPPEWTATPETEAPTATAVPPTPTEIPPTRTAIPTQPTIGTWDNPYDYAAGQEYEVAIGDFGLTWSIAEIEWGPECWRRVEQQNMFNDPAPAGLEYLCTRIVVRNTGSVEFAIAWTDFPAVSNGNLMEKPMLVDPEPALQTENLYPGGTIDGWTVAAIYQNDPAPMLTPDDEELLQCFVRLQRP